MKCLLVISEIDFRDKVYWSVVGGRIKSSTRGRTVARCLHVLCRSRPPTWLQRQLGHVEGDTPNGSEPRQGGERIVHSPEVISALAESVWPPHQRPSSSPVAVRCSHSTILVCKRRIVDLFPKLETAVTDIKAAEAGVMQMQMKRQKEFWFLLKIACVSTR